MPWPIDQVGLIYQTKTFAPRGLLKNRIPRMLAIGSFGKQKNGQPIQIGWLVISVADQQRLRYQLPERAGSPITWRCCPRFSLRRLAVAVQ